MELWSQKEQDVVEARLLGPVAADDPGVISILRNHFLTPPSTKPYNLSTDPFYIKAKHYGSWGSIHKQIKTLFGSQRGGFFIEAGALDGEMLSNTLWLEQHLGWTGLLVEPSPENYQMLAAKQRKAWTSHTCLSLKAYPKKEVIVSLSRRKIRENDFSRVLFQHQGSSFILGVSLDSRLYEGLQKLSETSYSVIQCFPLSSYLLALNVSVVDLLSLDIQGSEKSVLKYFPWEALNIRVIVIEVVNYEMLDQEFVNYMKRNNYTLINYMGEDYTFVRDGDPTLKNIDTVKIYL
ncbi:protein Star-like isoform X2 [Cherax quadricarinatus]